MSKELRIPTPSSDACRKKRLSLDRRRWLGKPTSEGFSPATASLNLRAARGVVAPPTQGSFHHNILSSLSLLTVRVDSKYSEDGFV